MKSNTGGRTSTSTPAASTSYAARHPTCSIRFRYWEAGANTIPPAETPAVEMPSARPRLRTNPRATAPFDGSAPMQTEPSATGPAMHA